MQSTLVVSKSILFLVAWWRRGYGGNEKGRGKNVERTRREARNFSRAKYHADWLEVMKFWWLIKCKKIYRLRPLCFSPSPFSSSFPSSSFVLSLIVRSFVPPPSFRGATAGFANWTEERLEGAKGDVGVKFKTRGNRLGNVGGEDLLSPTPIRCFSSTGTPFEPPRGSFLTVKRVIPAARGDLIILDNSAIPRRFSWILTIQTSAKPESPWPLE